MRKFGGTWSVTKLDCVEDYVTAYLRVMQNQSQYSLHYMDAFAGRGKQALKSGSDRTDEPAELNSFFGDESEQADTEEFLVGSAIRALSASSKSTRSFDGFVFIDSHRPSCRELESDISSGFPRLMDKVRVLCADANSALDQYVAKTDWTRVRAVVFLDPFGLEVNWATVKSLADTGACDVWYLFPLGGVLRMMTNSGQIPDKWRSRLDRVFGTPDWYAEFYRPSGQQSLLEDQQDSFLRDASTRHVTDYVRQRLLTIFRAVSKAGILRNGKGAPLFALVLGVASPSRALSESLSGLQTIS